jgi:peptidoglycan/LPS O-acetylase OafA/YrhL
MGLLRLTLALAVVYGHAGHFLGIALSPGDTPVQIFFAISGFYMALVLNEKYLPGSYRVYFTNRLFRLFPSYLLTLTLTVIVGWLAGSSFLFAWSKVTPWEAILAFPPQVLLVGQDALQFFSRADGQPFYTLAPVPQAWTLSLEICFYAMAPFLVRRSPSFIAAVIVASLAVRMILQFAFGVSGDPWSYRFLEPVPEICTGR